MNALILALFLHLQHSWAAVEGLESGATSAMKFRADGGSEDYQALDLSGKFHLDEEWHAAFEIEHTRKKGTGPAGHVRAGGGVRVIPELQLRAAFLYDWEPNSINGFGANLGLDWTSNVRDETEHETVLSLDFSTTTFRQKGGIVDSSKRLSRRFLRREWMFSVFQEVSSDFSMHGYGSLSSYPSAEGNLVNVATDQRRRRLPFRNGTLDGFPHFSLGIGGDVRVSELWTLGLDFSRSRVIYSEADAYSISPTLAYEFDNDWILGFHGTTTQQDLEDTVLIGALSLSHFF